MHDKYLEIPVKIAIKKAGEPLEIKETKFKYRSDCVREYIGKDADLDFVGLTNDRTLTLAVDGNGLIYELPYNFLISTSNPFYPIQAMVGTAVFARTKPVDAYAEEIWDFEVEDITQEDIDEIEKMLSKHTQLQLAILFSKKTPPFAL